MYIVTMITVTATNWKGTRVYKLIELWGEDGIQKQVEGRFSTISFSCLPSKRLFYSQNRKVTLSSRAADISEADELKELEATLTT